MQGAVRLTRDYLSTAKQFSRALQHGRERKREIHHGVHGQAFYNTRQLANDQPARWSGLLLQIRQSILAGWCDFSRSGSRLLDYDVGFQTKGE